VAGGRAARSAVTVALTDDPAAARKTVGKGLCASGKYRYDTRHAADRGQRAFLRKMRRFMSVYRCEDCHGWHLGSSLGGDE
jgi:hypothetical protein